MDVIPWMLYLHPPMQLAPINAKVMSLIPAQGEVYSIHFYFI